MENSGLPFDSLPFLWTPKATGTVTYRAENQIINLIQLALCHLLLASCRSEGWVRGSG